MPYKCLSLYLLSINQSCAPRLFLELVVTWDENVEEGRWDGAVRPLPGHGRLKEDIWRLELNCWVNKHNPRSVRALLGMCVWCQGYRNLCYCSMQIRALGCKHYPNWSFASFFPSSPGYSHRLNLTCYEARGTAPLSEWECSRLHMRSLFVCKHTYDINKSNLLQKLPHNYMRWGLTLSTRAFSPTSLPPFTLLPFS